jgi:hypothetical protein
MRLVATSARSGPGRCALVVLFLILSTAPRALELCEFPLFQNLESLPSPQTSVTDRLAQAQAADAPKNFESASWLHVTRLKEDSEKIGPLPYIGATTSTRFGSLISYAVKKTLHFEMNAQLNAGKKFPSLEVIRRRALRNQYVQYYDAARGKELDLAFEVHSLIQAFDWSLKEAPVYDGLLFRGNLLSPSEFEELPKMGSVTRIKQFLSTTLDPAVAMRFADVNLVLEDFIWRETHVMLDDIRHDISWEEALERIREEVFDNDPVRVLTIFDLRGQPMRALWLPPVYQKTNISQIQNLKNEDEVVLGRGHKFRTQFVVTIQDKKGPLHVRVLVPVQ